MRSTITTLTCDLCGFSTDQPEVFTQRPNQVDLCRWCMSGPVTRTECGGHIVTVFDDFWTCDCGDTMRTLGQTLLAHGVSHRAMDAAPNLPSALAAIHVQTPNWPRTY